MHNELANVSSQSN